MRLYCIILLSATLLCCSSSSKKITNDSNLKSLQVFAKSYSPSLENKENLPIPPKEIVSSLENTKHSKEKEKYLVTILLKLYQSHLSCCNQSYELRNDKDRMEVNNLILKNYLEGTQQYDLEKPIEFIPSSIAFDWVTKNEWLLKDATVKNIYNTIKTKRQKIESGDI